MNVLKVDSMSKLQSLVTRTILIQTGKFTISTITEQVMSDKNFNNFCDKKQVKKMVNATKNTLRRQGKIHECGYEYRVVC